MNKGKPSISWAELASAQAKGNAWVGRNFQSSLVSKSDTVKMPAINKACLTKVTHLARQG
jgi:hypothetical protein